MPSGIEWMMTCAPRKSSTLSEGCLGGSRGFLRMVFGTTGFANALNLMYGKQRRNVIFFSMGERRSGLETKDDIESISWTNMQILSNSCYVCWVFSKISYTSRLRHRTDVHMGMTSRSNMKLHWERRKKRGESVTMKYEYRPTTPPCAANWAQLVEHRRASNLSHRSMVIWFARHLSESISLKFKVQCLPDRIECRQMDLKMTFFLSGSHE